MSTGKKARPALKWAQSNTIQIQKYSSQIRVMFTSKAVLLPPLKWLTHPGTALVSPRNLDMQTDNLA